MIRSSILSTLILSLVLVAGCKKDPPGTTPPDDKDGQTAGNDGGKKDGGDKDGGDTGADGGDGDAGAGDENDPTKKVCPAETAEFPEVYFEETVMLRLPKNVTLENFVEMQPGFARLASDSVESVSCIEGMPGAVISYMALGSFPEDKSKPMTVWRDETLEAFGFAGSTMSEETVDEGKRMLTVTLDIPAGDKPEPARALFHMVAANGFMYALVMETHPDAWNALKSTFADTAAKMKFLKPQ